MTIIDSGKQQSHQRIAVFTSRAIKRREELNEPSRSAVDPFNPL
jgi:hypothetical protein